MCPAIRFGRFRRLEHQISWPYTGKIGIKTACRHGKSWVVLHSQTPSKGLQAIQMWVQLVLGTTAVLHALQQSCNAAGIRGLNQTALVVIGAPRWCGGSFGRFFHGYAPERKNRGRSRVWDAHLLHPVEIGSTGICRFGGLQGGTLANLRGWIERRKGKVFGAIALTGKPCSAKLQTVKGATA